MTEKGEEMVEKFLKYLQFEKRYSPRTVLSYQTDLTQYSSFLQKEFETTPPEANYGIIRSWIIQLSEEGLEPVSINRKIACLRSFYKFMMREGIVKKDPLLKIRVLKTSKKLPHFVKEDEMTTALDHTEYGSDHSGLRDNLILELLYGTGMRLSELIHLQETYINLRDRSIRVLGKRNKERVIPFTENIVSLLERYKEVRDREVKKMDHGFFLVTDEGKKLYPVMVYRIVKKHLTEANVDKKSPHVLRHTYATHLLNKGAEINAVKELLGHSSLAATQVYTHNTVEKLKRVFEQAHPKSGFSESNKE